MIDHNTLSLIKPKRLYEDKDCIINNGIIRMELGATTILAPFSTKLPSVSIKVKDLWSANLDEAKVYTGLNKKLPEFSSWNEIPITVADVTVFSSVSSVGEDTFYIGSVGLTSSGIFSVNGMGLTWVIDYTSQKLIGSTSGFCGSFDWYLFYYLFQMFKDLSGKKIGTLLWQEDKNNIYFTNVNKEFFVICSKGDSYLVFKDKSKDQIAKYFSGTPSKKSSYLKKQLQEESTGSEVKHLLRPLADLVNVGEFDHFKMYSSDRYILYATKDK